MPTKRQRQDALHAAMIAAQSPFGHRFGDAIAEHAAIAADVPDAKPKASDYTTKAGLAYGKSLGWAVLAVEEDRAYKKQGEWVRRKQDLKFAVDIIFRTPEGSVIGVQCGGRYEEPAHRGKFEGLSFGRDVGALYSAVRYWGFDRGEPVPVVVKEWWP